MPFGSGQTTEEAESMKNKGIKTVLAVMLLLALAGCGNMSAGLQKSSGEKNAASNSTADAGAYRDPAPQAASYYADFSSVSDEVWEGNMAEESAVNWGTGGSETPAGGDNRADSYDKIIYSGSANVETIRFEDTVKQVYELIEQYQGFLESAYVTGRDYNSQYYDRHSYRNAQFVIRVPRQNFTVMRADLDCLGSVTYSSIEAENITSAYRDTESRLNAYRVEESRLLDMLSRAEYVEDMLNIEDRLSNVRYQIESLTTTLTNWDSKVNYSTMRLTIQEVKELTIEKPIARTFGEDLRDGIQTSLDWMGQAGKNIVIYIVSALPLLAIPAILVVAIVLIIHFHHRKKRKNQALQQTKDVKVDN